VTNCYDAKTHLQVSQKGTRATPQGDTPFSSTLKDWRDVGGIKMPFSVDTQAGPITFTARLSDVKFDSGDRGQDVRAPERVRCRGARERQGRQEQGQDEGEGKGTRRARAGEALGRAAMSRKVILCRCEDVTLADIQHAVAAGYADLEEVKRYTGFGTGPCQGKECLREIALAICQASGTCARDRRALHDAPAARAHGARPARGSPRAGQAPRGQ